jgi:RNA polymerase sigma factor (sigma-70 family)
MMGPLAGVSDEQLLSRTPGDPQAFGTFYRRHERAMLAFFLRATRSAELAADLTAETFAVALGSLDSYRAERGAPGGWLFGIAKHLLSRSLERGRVENRARRRLGLPPLALGDDAIERIEAVASLNGTATALMEELPPEMRDAIAARVIDEEDYGELAARLRCSPSVARKRVSRGLARLRKQMEGSR